jgi:hypothetical protein
MTSIKYVLFLFLVFLTEAVSTGRDPLHEPFNTSALYASCTFSASCGTGGSSVFSYRKIPILAGCMDQLGLPLNSCFDFIDQVFEVDEDPVLFGMSVWQSQFFDPYFARGELVFA